MAGGTWSPTDMPVLPGFYMNFVAAALAAIKAGSRGVVCCPVKANWGPVREFKTITSEQGIIDTYTSEESATVTAYRTLIFALMGGAKEILAFRIADDAAAKMTLTLADTTGAPINVVRLDSIYPTDRAFKATVQTNPVDGTKKDIKLYEGTTLLRTFTFVSGNVDAVITAINDDAGNVWVDAVKLAAGNGTLANVADQAFAAGNDGCSTVLAADYTEFLTAAETQEFNVLTLDAQTTGAIQTSVQTWISRVREEGKGVVAVMGGTSAVDIAADAVSQTTVRSTGWNHEGVINVGVGGVLDGVSYYSAQVACWVAGLIAGQKLKESTTYAPAPFSDVTRRWTKSEMKLAIANGVFLLFHDGRIVKPLKGINTLSTLRTGQNNSWKKIRTIRVFDAINSDLQKTAEDNYIGKVNNTSEGRLALIGACKQYMVTLGQGEVIEKTGWDVYLDPVYYGSGATVIPAPDQVFLKWEAVVTDTMEQIFGTFVVI